MMPIIRRTVGKVITKLLRRADRRLCRISESNPAYQTVALLRNLGITTVLDVGANIGQYASGIRRWGFSGRIISFEPQSQAFPQLQASADEDGNWKAVNIALGDKEETLSLNVSQNSLSSSLLKALPGELQKEAGIDPVASELVPVTTLDSFCDAERLDDEAIFLKLDVQGYELAVLCGAERLLRRCKGVQLEMALAPTYEGQPLIDCIISALYNHGFRLVKIHEGFKDDQSGYTLEVDGIFVPREAVARRTGDRFESSMPFYAQSTPS
jgi:FkbM family methyltransferase